MFFNRVPHKGRKQVVKSTWKIGQLFIQKMYIFM